VLVYTRCCTFLLIGTKPETTVISSISNKRLFMLKMAVIDEQHGLEIQLFFDMVLHRSCGVHILSKERKRGVLLRWSEESTVAIEVR
jgi:hypothetical protein